MPNEPFNTLIRKGTIGKTLEKILGDLKPEAAYFTLEGGERSALMVININKPVITLNMPNLSFYNSMHILNMKL